MAHRGHTCSGSDICLRCGRFCPFDGRTVCLACAPSSRCLPWWLEELRQQDEDDALELQGNVPPAPLARHHVNANNGQDPAPDNPNDVCLRQRRYPRPGLRHHADNFAVASFIRHRIPCTPRRARHLSNAGFIAVDRMTLCCLHCGIRAPVSSLMMTTEEDAFKDAVIYHTLSSPPCQYAQGLLLICRAINQAF